METASFEREIKSVIMNERGRWALAACPPAVAVE